MSLFRRLLMAGLVLVIAGCAGYPSGSSQLSSAPSAGQTYTPADEQFRLGPEDRIQVQVWRNPDLSTTVPVRPDGMISVPLIGDVRAGGRTPEAVATAIEKQLSRYVRDPNVTVIVKELNSNAYLHRVRVTGAVEKPLSIPYRQGMTVLDLVLEAGGPTEFAATNQATLYRRTPEGTKTYQVHLGDILARGNLETNAALKPGDVVAVPERFF